MMIMKQSVKILIHSISLLFAKWIYLNGSKAMRIGSLYYESVKKLDINSCNYFYFNFFRLFSYICRCIITSWFFEAVFLIVIVANSIVLALDNPTDDTTTPTSELVDSIFLYLYTIEMATKIIGLGFIIGKNTYLQDPWNILDFIIVTTAWLPKLSSGENSSSLNSLRVLRVLRPLRTISSIKALRIILTSLFSAMRLLIDSMIVLLFFFMIFAIGGCQLFMGFLKRRCFNMETGIPYVTLSYDH